MNCILLIIMKLYLIRKSFLRIDCKERFRDEELFPIFLRLKVLKIQSLPIKGRERSDVPGNGDMESLPAMILEGW